MAVQVLDFLDRLPNHWRPRSDMQRNALLCPAEVLLLGGAAGSLKSSTILVDALKFHRSPHYNGIIFRNSYPETEFLIQRSRDLYSNTGGTWIAGDKAWRWPWGANLKFRYIARDNDVYIHQGPAYQYVGFDESTHFKSFQVRYILNSRMRTEHDIPLRMRLATNPGNVGHKWHMNMFIGPKCIHCIQREAKLAGREVDWSLYPNTRPPGKIFYDATWEDGVPTGYSTCFLPGRVDQHTLYGQGGEQYKKRLRGLPAALRQALMEGCWAAFEGQYFDVFDPVRHLISRTAIGEQKWWPYWISIDYGFGHLCAAYLWTMDPKTNMVYTLSEYGVHHRKAVDVAMDLKKLWGNYNLRAIYLGHDTFDHDGKTDFSMAEMMSQASGWRFDKAYNDRISGAMLMYTALSEDRWKIAEESCPELPSVLATRIHAPGKEEDVLKVKTEDEDDRYDAARYGLASHINPLERPEEEVFNEEMAKRFQSDPTAAMMYYRQQMAKKNKASKLATYTGRARSR